MSTGKPAGGGADIGTSTGIGTSIGSRITVICGDEIVAKGWHGAGNAKEQEKQSAGLRHCVNELQRHQRPAVVIFGDAKGTAAPAAAAALGFEVWQGPERCADAIYTYVADLPDGLEVHVIGETALLGQLRQFDGVKADGETLMLSALCALPGVGPKTAAAIIADGWPQVPATWMPRCRAAEKIKTALYGYNPEALRLRRVEIRRVEPGDLVALGLGHVRNG